MFRRDNADLKIKRNRVGCKTVNRMIRSADPGVLCDRTKGSNRRNRRHGTSLEICEAPYSYVSQNDGGIDDHSGTQVYGRTLRRSADPDAADYRVTTDPQQRHV